MLSDNDAIHVLYGECAGNWKQDIICLNFPILSPWHMLPHVGVQFLEHHERNYFHVQVVEVAEVHSVNSWAHVFCKSGRKTKLYPIYPALQQLPQHDFKAW